MSCSFVFSDLIIYLWFPFTITTDHLTFGHNDLTGTIPAELGKLTELKELRMYYNGLTGNLPSELCDLKKKHELKYLALDCESLIKGCQQDDGCCDRCV